jgi:N-acetylneuraminate lyase
LIITILNERYRRLTNLNGIYPALLTPFDKTGKIKINVLRQLVELNIEKGVDGFYVCGSTAEAFLLSTKQRKEILETVSDQVAGRCNIIAHVGTLNTDTSIDLAKHAQSCNVNAISSVPPFYYGFSFEEIKDFYFEIADSVEKPMIVYNFPAFSKVTLSEENIATFFEDERFIGLKHTSMDFFLLERIKNRFPSKVCFNGYDEMFVSGLAAGADGAIGSTFNFMAEKFIKIRKNFLLGDFAKVHEEQIKANNIISALVKVGVMQGEKAALCHMGLDFGLALHPFKAIEEKSLNRFLKIFDENL